MNRATGVVDQQPASPDVPRRTIGSVLGMIAVWAVVLAIPIALIGGGGFLLYQGAVGIRVAATVRGDAAYSRSLGLPLLLIAMGLPFLAVPVVALRGWIRARAN